MNRIWVSYLLFAGMLVVLPGATCTPTIVLPVIGPDNGGSPTDNGTTSVDPTFAAQVIELVNAERAANGLDALTANDLLAKAAQDYAQRMADMGFFAHQDPYTGEMPWDRAADAGYVYSYLGENIAVGQHTPQEVTDAWMNSPEHRANILSPNYTEIGVGVYEGGSIGIHWVQLFGKPG